MKNPIILETWFNTGLGDFYACLLSTKVAYDVLKNFGFDVELRINSHTNRYGLGLDEEYRIFLTNNFNLDYFDSYCENYVKVKNVQYAFEIYIHKESELFEFLNKYQFYGYSVENVATLYGGKSQEYPPIQNKSLLHPNLLKKLEEISEEFGEFYSMHFRFPDSHTLNEEKYSEIIKIISDVIKDNTIKNVFISSNVNVLNDINNENLNLLKLNLNVETQSNYNNAYYDLVNMCIFSYSKKIYSFRGHWSNYLTFALFNNEENLKYEEFIIEKNV